MYLRPYLSETCRQLILMLSLHRCRMPGRNVLLYIISGAPFLVSCLTPIPWACCGRMPILYAKPARETIVPIVEAFDRIWCCRCSCSSTKEWGNLIANRRYIVILRRLGKLTMSSTTISSPLPCPPYVPPPCPRYPLPPCPRYPSP